MLRSSTTTFASLLLGALIASAQAQQQIPLVQPMTPSDAQISQWAPPPGNTGMEPLPSAGAPEIVHVGGVGATRPGASQPSTFVIDAPHVVTQVMTYHYGALKPPGFISLQHEDGTTYGPWQAAGAVGQGGVANAYWWAQPNIVLKPGLYIVNDSDPASWSVEAATRGVGIFIIWGQRM